MDFQIRRNAVNFTHLFIGCTCLGRVFLSFYYYIFQRWIKYALLDATIKIKRENVYKRQESNPFPLSLSKIVCNVKEHRRNLTSSPKTEK